MEYRNLFDITKSQDQKYIITKLKYEAPNSSLRINLSMRLEQWHQTEEDANKYIEGAIYCINKFEQLNKEKNLNYDPLLIVSSNLNKIESWTCPISLISKYSIDELSIKLYELFVNEQNENKKRIEFLIDKKKNDLESFKSKEEEELHNLNDILQYGLSEEFLKTKFETFLENGISKMDQINKILKMSNSAKEREILLTIFKEDKEEK